MRSGIMQPLQSGKSECMHALQGMEVYSTVLWHLKREVDLSHLAQMAISLDRRSAHAWAIVGNCFSLQKVRTVSAMTLKTKMV